MSKALILDENICRFLCSVYFTKGNDEFEKASQRAYLDLCRTIKFNKQFINDTTEKNKRKNNITNMIKVFVKDLFKDESNLNAQVFNLRHEHLCQKIVEEYGVLTDTDTFTAGHAQKWVNMTLKYLYILYKCEQTTLKLNYEKIIKYFHIPVDKIILDEGKKLNVTPNASSYSWSTWDYGTYRSYQTDLIAAIEKERGASTIPILWELEIWKPSNS